MAMAGDVPGPFSTEDLHAVRRLLERAAPAPLSLKAPLGSGLLVMHRARWGRGA